MIEINGTFFIQLINFFVMIFFLNHFLFKPILKMAERRDDKMKSLASETAKNKNKTEKTFEEYEAKISEMKKTASVIIVEAKKEAVGEQEKIIKEARTQFSLQIENAKKEIAAETKDAKNRLLRETETISKKIAAKLLGRSLG